MPHESHRLRSSIPTLFLASSLLAVPLLAQPAITEVGPQVFGETVDVRVLSLEVVVERKGQRLEGLSLEDFVLTVDGEEMPIEFFNEIRGGIRVTSGSGEAAPDEPIGTRYLVFIDEIFAPADERAERLGRLRASLQLLRPEDQMAIVAYAGGSVDLLADWTSSQEQLGEALLAAESRPATGFATYRILHQERTRPGAQMSHDLEKVVDAATATLRSFGQPAGRRVLVLLGGTWPVDGDRSAAASAPVDYFGERSFGISSWYYEPLTPLVDTANLLGYTVYPVHVPYRRQVRRSLFNECYYRCDFYSAETSYSPYIAYPYAPHASHAAYSTYGQADGYTITSSRTSLRELATRTGGTLISERQQALEEIQEDVGTYYSIGFTPTWSADDQRHEVKVEVPKVRRSRVRMRDSFSDLSLETERTLRFESAFLFDRPIVNAGQLVVEVGEAEKKGWKKVLVPLEIEIPVGVMTQLPDGDGWTMTLELRVAVADAEGDRSDIPVVPLVVNSSEKLAAGEKRVYETHLKMRRRPHRMLISVLDPASGHELATRLDVDPTAR